MVLQVKIVYNRYRDTMSFVPTKSYFCVAEEFSSDEPKKGKYGYMREVRFYPFQTQKIARVQRNVWLYFLIRQKYEPKRNHKVCSFHFMDGKPFKKHPYPEPFAYNNFKKSLKVWKAVWYPHYFYVNVSM